MDRQRLGANLARLAAGERDAFDEVFAALWPALLALARRLTDADAEDAAQEALMKVLGSVDQYDPTRDGLSWAFAITVFEVRTLRKRRLRRRETAAVPEAASAATPEGYLVDAELRTQLAAVVDLLSDSDRAEIELYLAPRGPLDATRRKRRQRSLARLRHIWRTLYG